MADYIARLRDLDPRDNSYHEDVPYMKAMRRIHSALVEVVARVAEMDNDADQRRHRHEEGGCPWCNMMNALAKLKASVGEGG